MATFTDASESAGDRYDVYDDLLIDPEPTVRDKMELGDLPESLVATFTQIPTPVHYGTCDHARIVALAQEVSSDLPSICSCWSTLCLESERDGKLC